MTVPSCNPWTDLKFAIDEHWTGGIGRTSNHAEVGMSGIIEDRQIQRR